VHGGHQKVLQIGWPEQNLDPKMKAEDFTTSRTDYGG
jgi:hypothetical protein